MDLLPRISAQIGAVGLPLYAVTVTAVPRPDTPLLLVLHWHGFRRDLSFAHANRQSLLTPVPGSALQVNDRWTTIETIDAATLDAGWQLGAWDVERIEKRGCNHVAASAQESLECRQAFADYPLEGWDSNLVSEAPDRNELMQFAAEVGYVRWLFRPAKGGLWQATTEDDTLSADGGREPPCPVRPQAARGGRSACTSYRLGRVSRIILG